MQQPQAPDHKNLILAFVLSMLIIFGWHAMFPSPMPERPQAQTEANQAAQHAGTNANVVEAPTAITPPKAEPLAIISPRLDGSITPVGRGVRFQDLRLTDYRTELDKKSDKVRLLAPAHDARPYFAEFGWMKGDGLSSITLPDSHSLWQVKGNALTPNSPLIYTWQSPEGVEFVQEISVDENYLFSIRLMVRNLSNQAIHLVPYGLINRAHGLEEDRMSYISHEGILGVFDGMLEEATYANLAEQKKDKIWNSRGGWVGIADKYWLTAILPAQDTDFSSRARHYVKDNKHRFQLDISLPAASIESGAETSHLLHFYAGAKELKLLDAYGTALNLPLFDRAVDFGVLYFLTKPIFQLLQYFYSLVGNFGIAILILTVIIRLLVFPLANKSYKSLAAMRELQPKIMQLREKYGSDKMKMNQELMALYKKEQINPMAGCLPILLQIPIFFALYKVLYVAIEMRHAPFYGWIHDLSAPDPTSLFNAFGLLPYGVPDFLMIGVWPILMMITMIIQQHLQPPPADPVQAKVMQAIPYLFVFFFAYFPAGLVIYWTWSNVLSIIQQWTIIRIHGHQAQIKQAKLEAKSRKKAAKAE